MQRKLRFGDLLRRSLNYVKYNPVIWLGYSFLVGLVLIIGHISLALGVFSSVTSLFVGVGIAKYIDMKHRNDNPVRLIWAVKKSLPLAILAGTAIVVSWFGFMAVANLIKGDYHRILLFFYNFELRPEHFETFLLTETAAWVYAYANIALIFTALMTSTFLGWFTHPLMLFKGLSFSEARGQSHSVSANNHVALYQLLGFVSIQALICSGLTPLLTPILYMLTSTLIYESYRSLFEFKKS